MKAEYTDVWFTQSKEVSGSPKTVELPFRRVSARALVVRRRDRAILGALHQEGSRYALPGGAFNDGETSAKAVIRELKEENIKLISPDEEWRSRIAVDYYDGYYELSIWHVIQVDDAEIGESEELVHCRWIQQDEDVWHPFMHERLILVLKRLLPELAPTKLVID
jgi:8-oxo-dGTP pyrophosphatase MutT (NUDIX family)